MFHKCPVCKIGELSSFASANQPSSHKSVKCLHCGFSTGSLKPNVIVDTLLKAVDRAIEEPKRYLMRDNHTFVKLPDDNKAAVDVVMDEYKKGETYATVFVSGTGLKDSLELCEVSLVRLPSVVSEWLQKTSAMMQSVKIL